MRLSELFRAIINFDNGGKQEFRPVVDFDKGGEQIFRGFINFDKPPEILFTPVNDFDKPPEILFTPVNDFDKPPEILFTPVNDFDKGPKYELGGLVYLAKGVEKLRKGRFAAGNGEHKASDRLMQSREMRPPLPNLIRRSANCYGKVPKPLSQICRMLRQGSQTSFADSPNTPARLPNPFDGPCKLQSGASRGLFRSGPRLVILGLAPDLILIPDTQRSVMRFSRFHVPEQSFGASDLLRLSLPPKTFLVSCLQDRLSAGGDQIHFAQSNSMKINRLHKLAMDLL